MDNVYTIVDLDGYANQVRIAAAQSISDNSEQDNLDDFITIGEIINLVKAECLGYDNFDRPILDEDTNDKIFESTVIWIHNVGLAKLAAKDLVECAWDNDSNEMVFWTKEKKETNVKRKSKRKNMGDKK